LLASHCHLASDLDAALEVIYTEFVTREHLGQRPVPAEFCQRFPQFRDGLEQLFQIHDAAGGAKAVTALHESTTPIRDGSCAHAIGEANRVRVELVGAGAVTTPDLYGLLRRRLLIANVINIGFAAFASLASLFELIVSNARGEGQPLDLLGFLIKNWGNEGFLVFSGALVALLWRAPPATVRGLRAVELAFFGLVTGMFTVAMLLPVRYANLEIADLQPAPIRQAFIWEYAGSTAADIMLLLILYAVLIPNTWRRCAVVTGLMGAVPMLAFAGYSSWIRPLPPSVAIQVLSVLAFNFAATVSVVVFASSRIEHYRRQATEARKLGQYVLKERLGAGGMGEVYRAEHVLLCRPCALKVIRPDRASDPAMLQRFEREVQITATLTHPNTVQVFDYGHAADGTFYYVMEYLPGLTLEELVRRYGPLPPGRAVHFLRQVCAALGEAHARGLTHRDIKPGNVMVCERGGLFDIAKLLDFGLVWMPTDDPDGRTSTRKGGVAGTPEYMSPEQAGGESVLDGRSDIYSVGALAYFLLSGKPPFTGRSALQMLAAHRHESPVALPPDVPDGLAMVVSRCLAKAPAERWPDVASLEAALIATSVPVWTTANAADWWEQRGS
jgi:hypothetical protein